MSEDSGSYTPLPRHLDVPDATFACPDLTTFCRLDELGSEVTGQRLRPDRAFLACRITDDDLGVAAAARKASRVTASPASLRTNRWGGGPLPCWSPCAATDAPAARMCGAKTPARPPNRGPSCLGALCSGRWKPLSAST